MPARLKLMRWRINYLCYRKDLSTSRSKRADDTHHGCLRGARSKANQPEKRSPKPSREELSSTRRVCELAPVREKRRAAD
jgi:hypothetical protein